MATFIPAKNDWAKAFQSIGKGVSEGYMDAADEKALKKTVEGLGPNATSREILDAVTATKTYRPEAKKAAFKNYMGVKEFEETQRHAKKVEDATLAKANSKAATKENVKQVEKVNNFQDALKTIDEMEKIGAKGNLGFGSQFTKLFGGETAKDYGQYEQLGKSLIQLSTNIPIRNRQEFETLAHKLYDPSIPDKERAGILAALRSIITRNMESAAKGIQGVAEVSEEEAQLPEGLPDAVSLSGRTITSPEGVKYVSNGTTWTVKK